MLININAIRYLEYFNIYEIYLNLFFHHSDQSFRSQVDPTEVQSFSKVDA